MKKLYDSLSEQQLKVLSLVEIEKHSSESKKQLTRDKRSKESRSRDIAMIKEFFNDNNFNSVLCVGSRDEAEILSFTNSGLSCLGIDINENRSSMIRKMDARDIGKFFNNDEFDIIYARHSLEHVIKIEEFLNAASKICRLGMFIVLPPGKQPREGHPTHFNIMKYSMSMPGDFYSESDEVNRLILSDILMCFDKVEIEKSIVKIQKQNISPGKIETVILIKFNLH